MRFAQIEADRARAARDDQANECVEAVLVVPTVIAQTSAVARFLRIG